MFINNTIINNFIPSPSLREGLNNKYLTPKTALKPMHLVINQGADIKEDKIIRFAFKILPRQVERGNHTITFCKSIFVSQNELQFEEGFEGRQNVNFLHIFLSKPRKIFETTPNLFISRIFHGSSKEHYYQDPFDEKNKILLKLICASASRKKYTVLLHTDDKNFINHPTFVVYPERLGKIKIQEKENE